MGIYYVIDGKPAMEAKITISIGDAGLLYGFSLFETILIKGGRPAFLEQHLRRMAGSAVELGMTIPQGIEELCAMCREGISESGVSEGFLRLAVTAGSDNDQPGRTILSIRDGLPYRAKQYEAGFSIMTADYPRNEKSPLVRHKTANYLENLMARKKAGIMDYDECLFFNTQGNAAECSASNIFIVLGGKLLTPPVEAGLLPGIVRGLVINGMAGPVCSCAEVNFSYSDLLMAEECFITNSLMGIMPVVSIDRHQVGNGTTGKLTRALMQEYFSYLG